jgi:hypothetical protein
LKKGSTCQRRRQSSAIVRAGSEADPPTIVQRFL